MFASFLGSESRNLILKPCSVLSSADFGMSKPSLVDLVGWLSTSREKSNSIKIDCRTLIRYVMIGRKNA